MAYNVKHIHCPANGWDCPYYTDEGHPCRCTIGDPMADCDDFGYFYDEGDDYFDDDWVVEEEQTAQPTLTDQLINELKEKGCEMGYNGSTWYSLATIKKIAKEIESESANEPKCLKCGGMIEYDDCYDIECDGDWVERLYCGHCVDCNTDHLWSELYQFKGIEKLRIERDGDKNE